MLPWMHGRGRSALLVSVLVLVAGCATARKTPTATGAPVVPPPVSVSAASAPGDPEEAGVEVVGVRRTAKGYMLNFQYRVTDAEKAKELLKRRTAAYLVHEPSGARLGVPSMPLLGSLRQSTMEPEKDRVYFMLFSANGLAVSPGDKVSVFFGKYRFDHLTVQ
jgi:hypothetical protein